MEDVKQLTNSLFDSLSENEIVECATKLESPFLYKFLNKDHYINENFIKIYFYNTAKITIEIITKIIIY